MDENKQDQTGPNKGVDFRNLIQEAVREFVNLEQSKSEPAYKAELEDERRRREMLDSSSTPFCRKLLISGGLRF